MTTQRVGEYVLQHRGGGHHKEYRLWMERAGNGWHVRYAYGRIGMGMREGSKTQAPVSALEAQSIKDRVWDEKMRKGYVDVMSHGPARAERTPPPVATEAVSRMAVPLPVNRAGRCVIAF
jgi:predicted DNA-binding WGR domain protein